MKVLVVDDDGVSRLILRNALQELGYRVEVAVDGEQAWEMFQKSYFPLVISDWMMPGLDGVELCRRVRAHHAGGYTYFILVTARDGKQDRLHAIQAGADDFLSKPLDRAELESRLSVARRILEMEQRLRETNEELALKTKALEMSQEMIRQAILRFRELFENVPVACFTFDEHGTVYEWNLAAAQLYGWQEYEMLERSIFDTIIREEAREQTQQVIHRILHGEQNIVVESIDQCKDGTTRHVLRRFFPLHGSAGEVVAGICASVDITERVRQEQELRALNEQLKSLASTDAITGLLNHRALQDKLANMFASVREKAQPFSLIMLDIDHFKRFNDAFGHQAGDEVLRLVAQTLKQHSPPSACVARYGGEEMCVLLPGYDLRQAIQLAEELRQRIANTENPFRQITASFGVAEYKSYMLSSSELIEVADSALYEAKRAGRNCVRPQIEDIAEAA